MSGSGLFVLVIQPETKSSEEFYNALTKESSLPVKLVHNESEAMDIVSNFSENIAVATCDILTSGEYNCSLLKDLVANNIPVIAMTDAFNLSVLGISTRDGLFDYMSKESSISIDIAVERVISVLKNMGAI